MHEDWQKAIEKVVRPSQKKADTRAAAAATTAFTPDPIAANSPPQEGEDVPATTDQPEEPGVARRLYCDKCLHIADSPKGVVSGNIANILTSTANKNALQIDLGHLKKCDATVENCLRLSGPEIKKRRKDRTDEAKAAKTEEAKGDPPQEAPPARRGNKPRGKPGKGNATEEEAPAPAAVEDGGGGSSRDTPAEEEPEPPASKTAGKTVPAKKVERPAKATRSKGVTKAAESGPTGTTSAAPTRKAAGRPKKKTATEAEAQGQEPTEAGPVAAPTVPRRGRSGRRNEATTAAPETAPADGAEKTVPPVNKGEEPQSAAAATKTTRKRKSKMPH